MNPDRWEKRRHLLGQVVDAQMQMLASQTPAACEALSEARRRLQEHDAASLALFDLGIKAGRREVMR